MRAASYAAVEARPQRAGRPVPGPRGSRELDGVRRLPREHVVAGAGLADQRRTRAERLAAPRQLGALRLGCPQLAPCLPEPLLRRAVGTHRSNEQPSEDEHGHEHEDTTEAHAPTFAGASRAPAPRGSRQDAGVPAISPPHDQDLADVGRQLGRTPLPFRRVVARCPGGRPLAVEQPSTTPTGAPFPTTFWLTCPALVRAVGSLESAGGVAALEARLADDAASARAFDEGRARQIALRPGREPLGIAGTRAPRAVKCLHAHAAFALGAPPYGLGAEILQAAGDPPSRCCLDST